MARGWKITLILVPVAFVALTGILVARDDGANGTTPARVGRITEMEQSGEMSQVWEQHRRMIEQMQEDASPAMLELMNNDPMWQMMRTAEWARMDEQHQKEINEMLAK